LRTGQCRGGGKHSDLQSVLGNNQRQQRRPHFLRLSNFRSGYGNLQHIPSSLFNPVAVALLKYYPLPNLTALPTARRTIIFRT